MEYSEINILELLQTDELLSQRELSDRSGLSLGMVNLLIKRFVKIGLIKTERLNGNKIKYMLTPSGFSYLANKTIQYVSRSYQAVLKIRHQLKVFIYKHYKESDLVYIVAEEDEIYEILIDVLKEVGYKWERLDQPQQGCRYLTWGRIIDDGYGLDVFLNDKKNTMDNT